jgi:hypothetical protein
MNYFWDGFEKRAEEIKDLEGKGMISPGAGKRRYGRPRTDAERVARHGSKDLPPRGTGLGAMVKSKVR